MDKLIVNENQINYELTEKLKKEPKYEIYKNWLRANGVIWKDIDFPVAFGPTGVIGVAAAKDIPTCSPMIVIPNKLLVTTTKVKNGELSRVMSDHPELFEKHDDVDFNRKNKGHNYFLVPSVIQIGKDSFFYPMLNVIDNNVILLYWNEDEIKEIEDPLINREAKEFDKEMNKSWDEFRNVFEEYPNLFPKDKLKKEDFFWCYEAVMTRCFGWSLPSTMLVPMADFLNHSPDGTTHYIVNTEYERNERRGPPNYVLKKRKVDLSIFNDEDLVLSEEDKEIFLCPSTDQSNYIKKHIEYLSKENKQRFYDGAYRKKELKKMIRDINLNILRTEKNKQIWDLTWFESSNEEDNDTEADEESADQDQEQNDDDEDTEKKAGSNKRFEEEETKQSPTKESKLSKGQKAEEEDEGDEGDDEEDEEEDEEEEEEDDEDDDDEQARLEKEKYKYGNGALSDHFSPDKFLKHRMSKYEKLEVAKIKKKNVGSPKKTEEEERYQNDGDDSDWDWFDDNDDNNYFLVSTHPFLDYKKGEQVFSCYGRRTNRFLLMWYGFCIQNNRYNSLNFRLLMNRSSLNNPDLSKKILFKKSIDEQDQEDKPPADVNKLTTEDLTKEFRVKMDSLCEDVLTYLRGQLLITYKGPDIQRILVTIPTSIPYEEFMLDYALSLFIEIKNQYKTSVYQDEEILKDLTLNAKKRFAVVYRLEQKKIADLQINLLRILQDFLGKIKNGVGFKDSYMEPLPDIDRNDDEFIENRRKLANYLKMFHNNYTS